jgi:hypothetical protein
MGGWFCVSEAQELPDPKPLWADCHLVSTGPIGPSLSVSIVLRA